MLCKKGSDCLLQMGIADIDNSGGKVRAYLMCFRRQHYNKSKNICIDAISIKMGSLMYKIYSEYPLND